MSADELNKLIAEIDALAEKATPGPVFIGDDDAEDTIAHKNSGLALIDTGRRGDWPIARLQEWNEARFYAALRNAWPTLRAALQAPAAGGAQGWIPVGERLPETEDEVLIYAPSTLAKIRTDCWRMQREAPISFSSATIETGMMWDEHEFEEVTHWMPLPPPPHARENNGGEDK